MAFIKPLQLFISVIVAFIVIRYLGVSLLARQAFSQYAQIAIWVAFAWIIWGLIDAFADRLKHRLMRRGQFSVLSAVVFIRRGVKFALVVILAITVLDSFGFEVTTWLAALGIGGIALALGAQKTVENFVGSLTLIADRPIAIGDFCRFGTTKGTVEDIGMRSTRIRTTDRTLVSIPNGEFSSMQIENYSRRDGFAFAPILGLRYDTTTDQMRYFLQELRVLLREHPKVRNDGLRVNFIQLSQSSLDVEVTAIITAKNIDEAVDVKEEINLQIIDLVKKAGTDFAFPTQTLYLARDVAGKKDKS